MKKHVKFNRFARLVTLALVAALAGALILSTAAFAAGPGNGRHTPGTGRSVDVAPVGSQGGRQAGTYGAGQGFVDADGDGVCDYRGTGQGLGANFVDENGDGVCDYLGTGQGLGRRGPANGGRGARGGGMGFVDADGDGVCDRFQAAR